MAHALGVERRARCCSNPTTLPSPTASSPSSTPRLAHEPVAYITRPPRLLDDRLAGRPRRADPAARQRDADRGGDRSFRRPGPSASSISAPAPARCCSPRWTNGPRRPASASMRAARARLCRRNALALGLEKRAELRLGDWRRECCQRFDLILCNPPYIETGAPLLPDVADHEPPGGAVCGRRRARRLSPARRRTAAPARARRRGLRRDRRGTA